MAYQILFVDDDRFFHALATYALRDKSDKLHLTTCFNLAEAREHLANKEFDAVLLDFQLPDGEGPELLPEISEKTAVLLLSGLPTDYLAKVQNPRIQRILNKHEISPHSLQQELLNAIQRQKLSLYRRSS